MDRDQPPPRTAAIVATVLNEGESIRELMESLVAQTRAPDEVVFVDGGSADNTIAVIQSYADRLPLRVLVREGANISRGRNEAIQAATSEIIAATDAGVRLGSAWLETLVKPFACSPGADSPGVVCGFFLADPRTPFETALGATILPHESEIDSATFLPSSRSVAFLRSAWAKWPYPEWLDYCEDLVFDIGLKELGYAFDFQPSALARFRPRASFRSFFKQYHRYARGDGKADLWRRRHLARYSTYLLAGPAILALSIWSSPAWLLLLAAGAYVYLRAPYRRLVPALRQLPALDRLQAVTLVPAIRVVGDVAKMIGYPVGLLWRWEHRKEGAVHWRQRLAGILAANDRSD